MTRLRIVIHRFRAILLGGRLERDLDDEIRSHLDLAAHEYERRGMSPYSVVSYSVNQRAPEFGLRMALGATASDLRRHVILRGLGLALAGVILAAIGGAALSHIMRAMLYGVSTSDPVTFIVSSALAVIVTAAACYLPARCATQVDPMSALRSE